MWVKICANTNLADAKLAAELGANAVGFVFAPSKRQVTAEQVAEITRHLPDNVDKVGVFDARDPYEVEHFIACTGLNVAQLHSSFDAEMVRLLHAEFGGSLRVVQTVAYALDPNDLPAADERFEKTLDAVLAEPAVWAVLLDAAKAGASGGLGVAFDWGHVAPIVERAYTRAKQDRGEEVPKLIVAGGLNAENVARAIELLHPFGVDVASGVEESPGRKSPEKLRAFLHAANSAR